MGQSTETRVYFGVFEFGDDPAVVTRLMSIEPTVAWAKGDPHPVLRSARWHYGRWELRSSLPLEESLENHLLDLLPKLESRREAVTEANARFDAALVVATYLRETNPEYTLSADLLRRIANLGLEMDFDLYCVGERGE